MPADWLTDDVADALMAGQRPHPTLPAADLDRLDRDSLALVRRLMLWLPTFRRTAQHGGSLAATCTEWEARSEDAWFVRQRVHDARLRDAHIDVAVLGRRIAAIEAALDAALGVPHAVGIG